MSSYTTPLSSADEYAIENGEEDETDGSADVGALSAVCALQKQKHLKHEKVSARPPRAETKTKPEKKKAQVQGSADILNMREEIGHSTADSHLLLALIVALTLLLVYVALRY